MAFVIKFVKGVRKHWKKSAFAATAISYGLSYSKEKYEINQIMRDYCSEAQTYGDVTIPVTKSPRKVIVILNPAANKRSSEKSFENYCEPILHLAGLRIELIKTDSEGHARRFIQELETLPDAIIIAGGDGTVSEAITGLLRRSSVAQVDCPIGVLPIGRTNSVGSKLFHINNSTNVEEVKGLARAAISVVRGKTEKKDIMKIEVLSDESDRKPIYAMGSLQWGAYRDVISLRDRYWYTGPLREYTAFLFNAFSKKLTWNCDAKLLYTPPCSGCSNCYIKPENVNPVITNRWWSKFMSKPALGTNNPKSNGIDFSKISNADCSKTMEIEVNPSELYFGTANVEAIADSDSPQNLSKITVKMGDSNQSSFKFLTEGWRRLRRNDISSNKILEARTIQLLPNKTSAEEKEFFYSIDNEDYEVKPIKLTLLPKVLNVYSL